MFSVLKWEFVGPAGAVPSVQRRLAEHQRCHRRPRLDGRIFGAQGSPGLFFNIFDLLRTNRPDQRQLGGSHLPGSLRRLIRWTRSVRLPNGTLVLVLIILFDVNDDMNKAIKKETENNRVQLRKKERLRRGVGTKVVSNVERVIAIELLAACQAIEFLRPLKTTVPLEEVYKTVRARVRPWDKDRFMAPDIDAATQLLQEDKIWNSVKGTPLHGAINIAKSVFNPLWI